MDLQHNLDILYNDIGYETVYVDQQGNLQVDDRGSLWKWLWRHRGDYSHQGVSEASIQTLRLVLDGLEKGEIPSDRVVHERRSPAGLFMSRPQNGDWVNRADFGKNVGNMDYFKTWMPSILGGPVIADSELTSEELINRKVTSLTQMIWHGKEYYKSLFPIREEFYD